MGLTATTISKEKSITCYSDTVEIDLKGYPTPLTTQQYP
jgi:hypothetical protein